MPKGRPNRAGPGDRHPELTTGVRDDDQWASRGGLTGLEAARLAGVSYRQLDYWARRGWIVPSVSQAARRRAYSVSDVVRVAALGHLGRSKVDVARYAATTGRLVVPVDGHVVVIWAMHNRTVRVVPRGYLRRALAQPVQHVVYDPGPLLRELRQEVGASSTSRPRRRRFSPAYKRLLLDEYDRLTAPGAKSALLRAEGLHTSHLVGWRRAAEAGRI